MKKIWIVSVMVAGLAYAQEKIIPQMQLYLKHTALICDKPSRLSECKSYRGGLVIRSKAMNGTYYRISDMAGWDGAWHVYEEEGWIDKLDVAELHENDKMIVTPERIRATTLVVQKGACVCDEPKENAQCVAYKDGTVLTSSSKFGHYYKISGIGTVTGWQPFAGEGWIEESSVDIRR